MDKYFSAISSSKLFANIKEDDLKALLNCMGSWVKTYAKGEYIAIEQAEMHNIGFILSGKVDMIKEDLWGNKTILVRMGYQDIFGETFACGDNHLSEVTFLAVDDTAVLFMPFDRVMRSCNLVCNFHHRLIENMVILIAEKNVELMRKVEVTTKKTLREKILAYLSQQSQIMNDSNFEIPLGRLELADYLCADRSALTRELAKMKKDGLIDYNRNTFKIL